MERKNRYKTRVFWGLRTLKTEKKALKTGVRRGCCGTGNRWIRGLREKSALHPLCDAGIDCYLPMNRGLQQVDDLLARGGKRYTSVGRSMESGTPNLEHRGDHYTRGGCVVAARAARRRLFSGMDAALLQIYPLASGPVHGAQVMAGQRYARGQGTWDNFGAVPAIPV